MADSIRITLDGSLQGGEAWLAILISTDPWQTWNGNKSAELQSLYSIIAS